MGGCEILAPAGTMEALLAGVRCGADAVYLGMDAFNARRNAENFTPETLKQAVKYCHERKVNVYLTLNTLVADHEMSDAARVIRVAAECHIDAFIIQDLGLVNSIRKIAPDIRLHASTQMSVQTLEGLKLLKEMGFSRAVLPRELTKKEIAFLAAHSPVELEVFVHGALCMSVSGQCYMSAMLGSRSGNRGLCAQPCRLPFSSDGTDGYDLSLKDLSLIDYASELAEMGISSLKIEGRMKRPEYAAAAVSACRKALGGEKDEALNQELRSVFSRSGFTKGYYEDKRGRDMFGIRQKEDVVRAKHVLDELKKRYEKETPRFPVSFDLKIKEGRPVRLSAFAEGLSACAESEKIPEKAQQTEITFERAQAQMLKCGGTAFCFEKMEAEIDRGLSVPVSVFNTLRRNCLTQLSAALCRAREKSVLPYALPDAEKHVSVSKRKNYLCFENPEQIPDAIPDGAVVFLPLHADEKTFGRLLEKGYETGITLPRGIFGNSSAVRDKLEILLGKQIRKVICPTLDTVAIADEFDCEKIAGFGTNIFNTYSLEKVSDLNVGEAVLSAELTKKQMETIGGKCPRGFICYGRIPLMLTRNCPVKNKKTCAQCGGKSVLTDRKGIAFPVNCRSGCTEIYNAYPIYVLDKMDSFQNIDFYMYVFTVESKEECEAVLQSAKWGKKPVDIPFTRGLYYRGVE